MKAIGPVHFVGQDKTGEFLEGFPISFMWPPVFRVPEKGHSSDILETPNP